MSPRSFAEVTSRTPAKAVYMRFFHTRQTVSRQLPVNVKFGRNSEIFVIAAIRSECQKWSMEMIMSKSKPITLGAAIFYGGLIAGILDAADGFVAYYFAAVLNPIQVLQFVASGFYGAAAFAKGIPRALAGLLAHFSIAFAVAAIYVGATRFLPMLSREAVMWGTMYGATVCLARNIS